MSVEYREALHATYPPSRPLTPITRETARGFTRTYRDEPDWLTDGVIGSDDEFCPVTRKVRFSAKGLAYITLANRRVYLFDGGFYSPYIKFAAKREYTRQQAKVSLVAAR